MRALRMDCNAPYGTQWTHGFIEHLSQNTTQIGSTFKGIKKKRTAVRSFKRGDSCATNLK